MARAHALIIGHRKSEGKPAAPMLASARTAMRPTLKPLVLCVLCAALAASLAACRKAEERFESTCQIVRRDVVEVNDKAETEVLDVEIEWDPCPGDQYQVVRGGKEFAACMQRYNDGQLVPVLVKHWWDDRGYFVWDVYKVGECARDIESYSEGSYEKSQACTDLVMHGRAAGFSCDRRPFKGLVATCPWLARQ